MKKLITVISALAAIISAVSCGGNNNNQDIKSQFVRVGEDGDFYIGDSSYHYVGTNFWYGAILASEGRGGDRVRLKKELDFLNDLGLNNLRVLVGGDGKENLPCHIMPVLQYAPGLYNDTILDGLDYFMAELEKRNMKAVLYLNNSWEWSGGYGTYLEWVTGVPAPVPSIDGYQTYVSYVSDFVLNDSAKALAANHVKNIVSRTNRYTGKPYSQSPAIMSWQISNEPRAFNSDSIHKAAFAEWISSTAALIKSIDPNHMVSTGSEGYNGCEVDLKLWAKIHEDPNIDYGTIHIWPYNWRWIDSASIVSGVDSACVLAREYVAVHADIMKAANKPLVLEEFGYPRDNMSLKQGSPVLGRDNFYSYILSLIDETDMIDGCNFWGWGGFAVPDSSDWHPWQPFTGDPAQEPQGLNSIFATDSSTLSVIEKFARGKK